MSSQIATPIRQRGFVFMLAAALFAIAAMALSPLASVAQQSVGYAYVELNMRAEPDANATIIAFVPRGAQVTRTGGAVVNGYAPVVYLGASGWVVALGIVDRPEDVSPAGSDPFAPPPTPTPTPTGAPAPAPTPAPVASDVRVTLAGLVLRAGPSINAEPILVMPAGATVTLTREGAENGYVTVDYGGAHGWAYADLLARPDEV